MSELSSNYSDVHLAHSSQYILEVKLGELRSNSCGAPQSTSCPQTICKVTRVTLSHSGGR